MPGTDYESAIDVHICRSVVSRAGCHVQGMSAAYENQALAGFALPKNRQCYRWQCYITIDLFFHLYITDL